MQTLKNGLNINVHTDSKKSGYFAVNVLIKAGSVHDEPGKNGTAHFLEHLLMKDIEDLQKGWVKPIPIDSMNASTHKIRTDFECIIPTQNTKFLKQFIELICNFDVSKSKHYDTERLVLHEELLENEEDEQYQYAEESEKWLYENSAYSLPTGGNSKDVSALTPEDIQRFFGTHYVAGNIFVSICGDFDSTEVSELLESITLSKKEAPSGPKFSIKQKQSLFMDDGKKQTSLELNKHVLTNSVDNILQLELCEAILNDFIFYYLRKEGLAYRSEVSSFVFGKDSILSVLIVSSNKNIKSLEEFSYEINKNPSKFILESDFVKFKDEYISRLSIWNSQYVTLAHNLSWYAAYFNFSFDVKEIKKLFDEINYAGFLNFLESLTLADAAVIKQGKE